MSRCTICSMSGSPGNPVWDCPICGRMICAYCLEKHNGQAPVRSGRKTSSYKCPRCDAPMIKASD